MLPPVHALLQSTVQDDIAWVVRVHDEVGSDCRDAILPFDEFQCSLLRCFAALETETIEDLYWAFGASERLMIPMTRLKFVMGMEILFSNAKEFSGKFPGGIEFFNFARPFYIFALFNRKKDNQMVQSEFFMFLRTILRCQSKNQELSEADSVQYASALRYGGSPISLVVFCHYAGGIFQKAGIPLDMFKLVPSSLHSDPLLPIPTPPKVEDSVTLKGGLETNRLHIGSAVIEKVLEEAIMEETAARFTFVLPPVEAFDTRQLRVFYERTLDIPRLNLLQQCGAINNRSISSDCIDVDSDGVLTIRVGGIFSALLPISVKDDGNCLLHAVSVAMWEYDDTPIPPRDVGFLREALRQMLSDSRCHYQFKNAWRQQKAVWDKLLPFDVEKTEEQWTLEWSKEIEWAQKDRNWLSEIHVFVLAHIVKRPIILFADTRQFDSSCYFSGIYLPRFWPSSVCERVPLLLAYESSHFVPLVYHLKSHDVSSLAWRCKPLIPLEANGKTLECLFCVNETRTAPTLLSEYLIIKTVLMESGTELFAVSLDLHWRLATSQEEFRSSLGGTFPVTNQ